MLSFFNAKKQFNENFQLTNLTTQQQQHNLYAGLANLAKGLQNLQNIIRDIESRIEKIERK